MSGERPLFLVVDVDGLVAIGVDESEIALTPEAAATLGSPAVDSVDVDGQIARPVPGSVITIECPVVLAVTDDGVEAWSAVAGRRIPVDGGQLEAMTRAGSGVAASSPLGARLAPLVHAGVLVAVDPVDHDQHVPGYLRQNAADPSAEVVMAPGPAGLVPLYSSCPSHISGVPLALGMLVASIAAHDGGRLSSTFDIRPVRRLASTIAAEVAEHPVASVSLHSNYMWSVDENLALAAEIAATAPGSISIHGGPSTPKYPADVDAFFDAHPAVDVLVLGEGEATVVEVLDRLCAGLDVDAVAGVPGTVVRRSDGVIQWGPERDRLADLAALPSPFLTGVFDHLDGGLLDMMPVETNRGCPYGCTFCDWGSATMSRIRQFPLDRVFAELEWIASRGVATVFIADANFGIVPRDLEIARRLVELRQRYGAPRMVLVSFAKNQTLRAAEIVQTWIEGGIVTEGSIALQTSDAATLEVIDRRNIRVERYDELTDAFHRLHLPLAVDLMMGLPGSTLTSFAADLQRCVDRELTARIYPTIVLPNSPMNEPGYRTRHGIRIDSDGVVVGTDSYDDEDYDAMLRLRRVYRAGDHFGILRHVARWAQRDHGVAAVELYRRLLEVACDDPRRWPSLVWISRHLPRWTVPPAGWRPLLEEVRSLLTTVYGLPDDSAMATALAVQEAHLPWPDAQFPRVMEVQHDYVAWAQQLPSSAGHRPLRTFGSGAIEVDDPRGVCSRELSSHFRRHGHPDVDSVMMNEFWIADEWELDSPLTRRLPQVVAAELSRARRPDDTGTAPVIMT